MNEPVEFFCELDTKGVVLSFNAAFNSLLDNRLKHADKVNIFKVLDQEQSELIKKNWKLFSTENRVEYIQELADGRQIEWCDFLRKIDKKEIIQHEGYYISELDSDDDILEDLDDLLDEYLFVINESKEVVRVNSNALKALSLSRDEIFRKPVDQFFSAKKRDLFLGIIAKAFENDADNCHLPMVASDGTEIPSFTRFKLAKSGSEKLLYLFVADLRFEQFSSDSFNCLFDSNPSIMLVVTTDDNTILNVNHSFERILNYNKVDVVNKTLEEVDVIDSLNICMPNSKIIDCPNLKNIELNLKTREGLIRFGLLFTDLINYSKKSCILIIINDITERKQALVELERSGNRYRELTEFLPEMICETDTNGKLLYVNKYALERLGYQEEEVYGDEISIFSMFAKEDQNSASKNFGRIIRDRVSLSNEYVILKKNREQLHVIIHTTPLIDEGIVKGVRGVMIDITKLKKSENLIKHNLRQQQIVTEISLNLNTLEGFEDRIQHSLKVIGKHTNVSRIYIYENSEDGLFTSNTFEWCNDGIEAQIDELQNVPYELIPSWKKLLIQDKIVQATDIYNLPDDIVAILEPQGIKSVIVLPLVVNGNFFGFVGFDECNSIRDWTASEIELLKTITSIIANSFERKIIEKNLIEKELEHRTIIDSIPDVIVHLDKDGNVISYKSSSKDKIFSNLAKDKVQNVLSLPNDEIAKGFLVSIKECISNGSFKFDFSFLNREILEYHEARFVKLNENEVVAIIRDVTETMENEKQLQIAKNKAEEASKAKSEFLANVSHEIRTPMNAILGFSEWLYDNVDNELHRNYLHTILTSGRTLLSLINDILDLSKIESGKMTIELEPIQYRVVVNDVAQIFKQKLDNKGVSLNISTDDTVPSFIYMDEVRFHQIIFNLVSNAIKFTAKGFVNISAFATKASNDNLINLIVEVEDTGIGIPEDQQKNIFKAFTQQSGQSNRYYEGTGLGLTIVSGLVKKMNASISLRSKVGKGSVFSILFKDVKVAEVTEQDKVADKEHFNMELEPCTILIVDDVEFNILLLKRIIEFKDVTFLEAQNGEQALEVLQSNKPDLIFMDIRMPGMNGYSATDVIKENPELKHIPVVAFTASTMSEDQDKIDEVFDAFLQKPVFKKEVMAVLKRFLPYKYTDAVDDKKEITASDEIMLADEILEILPDIIKELEGKYHAAWENVKDDLILFEIEEFAKELSNFAFEKSCNIVEHYCRDLNMSLQSFDVELIEKKLNEYPELIEKLKSHL